MGGLTLHVWPRKTKQKPFGAARPPPRELTSKWGRGLENLTMPGGRRVTAEEGQKRSFASGRTARGKVWTERERPSATKSVIPHSRRYLIARLPEGKQEQSTINRDAVKRPRPTGYAPHDRAVNSNYLSRRLDRTHRRSLRHDFPLGSSVILVCP